MATTSTPPTILEDDPQDILLDETGDIVLDGEGLHFVSGIQGVIQGARIRMLAIMGEWFLNLDFGIDYYGDVLFENYDETRARIDFSAAILDTPGINAITSLLFNFNAAGRLLSVVWSASSQFGDTPQNTLNLSGPTQPQTGDE